MARPLPSLETQSFATNLRSTIWQAGPLLNTHLFVLLWFTMALSFPVSGQSSGPQNTDIPQGVPRLLKFNGVLTDASGQSLNGLFSVSFSVYSDATGGTPLWEETQNIQFSQGQYTVFLGETNSGGIPAGLFSSGEPRWLGVRVVLPDKEEEPRVFLTAVPYAFKAVDADTLGGLPASAFVHSGNPVGIGDVSNGSTAESTTLPHRLYPSAQAVTTPGGTVGVIPMFDGFSDIANSPLITSSGNVVLPGQPGHPGQLSAGIINNVLQVDLANTAKWNGNDVGAWINDAQKSACANGCRIKVAAGTYTQATQVVVDHFVHLECDRQGTTINYSPGTGAAGTAFTFSQAFSYMDGCQLVGPVSSSSTAIGIQVNNAHLRFSNFVVQNFQTGIEFGSNAYLDTFDNFRIVTCTDLCTQGANTQAIVIPLGLTNFGENISFKDADIYSNVAAFNPQCISIGAGSGAAINPDLTFVAVSFDQCGMTVSSQMEATFTGTHWEAPLLAPTGPYLTVTGQNAAITFNGGRMVAPSGTPQLISDTGGSHWTFNGTHFLCPASCSPSIPQVITGANTLGDLSALGVVLTNVTKFFSGTWGATLVYNIGGFRQETSLAMTGGISIPTKTTSVPSPPAIQGPKVRSLSPTTAAVLFVMLQRAARRLARNTARFTATERHGWKLGTEVVDSENI